MTWQNIRYVPVENDEGNLAGLVSSRNLIDYFSKKFSNNVPASVAEIMIKDLQAVKPETKTTDALQLLREHYIGCLPVVRANKLVGLVTERDFMTVAEAIFREAENQRQKEVFEEI